MWTASFHQPAGRLSDAGSATADKTQEASDISAEDTQEEDGQASDTDTTDDETEIAEPEDGCVIRCSGKMYPLKQHPLRFPLKKKRAR